MKIAKILVTVVIIAVLGWLTWNYFHGPLRYKREMNAFADSVEVCEAVSISVFMFMGKQSLVHAVEGAADGRCKIHMETAGPHVVDCAFPVDTLPTMAQGFRDQADSVDIFGGFSFKYDSSNPDDLTAAMNSDICETKIP